MRMNVKTQSPKAPSQGCVSLTFLAACILPDRTALLCESIPHLSLG